MQAYGYGVNRAWRRATPGCVAVRHALCKWLPVLLSARHRRRGLLLPLPTRRTPCLEAPRLAPLPGTSRTGHRADLKRRGKHVSDGSAGNGRGRGQTTEGDWRLSSLHCIACGAPGGVVVGLARGAREVEAVAVPVADARPRQRSAPRPGTHDRTQGRAQASTSI